MDDVENIIGQLDPDKLLCEHCLKYSDKKGFVIDKHSSRPRFFNMCISCRRGLLKRPAGYGKGTNK